MEVAVIDSHEVAVSIHYVISRYLGVINLDILVLLETDTIEVVSKVKDGTLHTLQFEIGTEHVVADAILGILQFLAVERPIPGHQLAFEAERLGIGLHLLHLFACSGHISIAQLIEEVHHIALGLSTGLVQRFLGIVFLAEELCILQTGVDDIDDILRVVKLAANATGVAGHIDLLTQGAVRAVLQYRQQGCGFQVQEPTFHTLLFGFGAKHTLGIVIQAFQLSLVGDEFGPGIGSLQHVLTVGGSQL